MEEALKKNLTFNSIIKYFAILMSLYHIYNAITGGADPLFYRFTHVSMALFLGYILLANKEKGIPRIMDYICAAISLLTYLYFYLSFDRLVVHIPFMDKPTTMDTIVGIVMIILVLEGARKYIGWLLSVVALVFLLYSLLGPMLPGILYHSGLNFLTVIDYMTFTLDGIFGSAVAVSSHYLILFVIFGSFLAVTGVGEYFTELATALAGGTRGGPAKVAVLSSALIGSIIGSATANVSTTGVFTIPLMRRIGFKREFAGAVEAAASTGGAMLPPIMGSSAFLMAEILGIPYLTVAKASLIPAVIYYLALLIMVDLEALKSGLLGLPKSEMPVLSETLKKIYNIAPLVIIIGALFKGYSPSFAALLGIAVALVLGLLNSQNRLTLGRVLEALEKGSKTSVQIIMACGAAGIIVGTVSLTGLSGKFTSILLLASGGIEILILFFIMLSAIVLGMGMTISPAYIMAAVLGAPALVSMGFKPIAAHLFVLYFAALAPLTPPVAISAYVAAGIAEANMNKTAWKAVALSSTGFLIPYIFIYNNELLLMGSGIRIGVAVLTALIGVTCFAFGVQGYFTKRLNAIERTIAILGGLSMLIPGWTSDIIGVLALGILFALSKRNPLVKSEAVN